MGTLTENAAEVATLAGDIDDAIEAKGGTLVSGGGLRNAAAGIESIQTGSQPVITPLSVVANGTYTAPSGTDGYSPVTVNVGDEWDGDETIIIYDLLKVPSASLTLNLPSFAFNGTVDWGDGSPVESIVRYGAARSHTYASRARWTITLTPTMAGYMAYNSNISNIDGIVEVFLSKVIWFTLNDKNGTYFPSYAIIHYPASGCKGSVLPVWTSPSANGKAVINNSQLSRRISMNRTSPIQEVDVLGDYNFTMSGENEYSGNLYGVISFNFKETSEITITKAALANTRSVFRYNGLTKINMVGEAKLCFLNNNSLYELPDTIDASTATDLTNSFNGCTSLVKLPSNFSSNVSVSFAGCTGVTNKDSVATFTDGTITGGFVYNLNTCANSGQTITFNSTIKALFDETEQAAIEAALTAKNWTCAW